jgi:L-alanine-DL-glutamate epimerase-like enolase superfamily enzyme
MSALATGAMAGDKPDSIREVTCFDCSVPLPQPLLVGQATVTRRTYAVVRIRTEQGLDGAAYAFGRGLPVATIIERSLAPILLGADPSLPELIRAQLAGAYWPYAERGLFSVAASAVDLALWDLLGKRAELPMADLLGKWRNEVPVCAVGGYKRQGSSELTELNTLQSEMAGFVDLRCKAVKVAIGADDPAADVRRLAAVREVVGDDCIVVADAFRSFTSLDDAIRRLRLLEPFDLSYVEDPFSETLAPLVAELRRRSPMLIGLGENLAGHRAFRELLRSSAADVVRCDATVIGGVREFMAAAALASAHGLEVSAHVHANIHVHFGAALANLHPAGLEYMPPNSGLDGLDDLLSAKLEIRDGAALVSERPGLGLDWNWDAVARHADV